MGLCILAIWGYREFYLGFPEEARIPHEIFNSWYMDFFPAAQTRLRLADNHQMMLLGRAWDNGRMDEVTMYYHSDGVTRFKPLYQIKASNIHFEHEHSKKHDPIWYNELMPNSIRAKLAELGIFTQCPD